MWDTLYSVYIIIYTKKRYHGQRRALQLVLYIRSRWEAGDENIIEGMKKLAELTGSSLYLNLQGGSKNKGIFHFSRFTES